MSIYALPSGQSFAPRRKWQLAPSGKTDKSPVKPEPTNPEPPKPKDKQPPTGWKKSTLYDDHWTHPDAPKFHLTRHGGKWIFRHDNDGTGRTWNNKFPRFPATEALLKFIQGG